LFPIEGRIKRSTMKFNIILEVWCSKAKRLDSFCTNTVDLIMMPSPLIIRGYFFPLGTEKYAAIVHNNPVCIEHATSLKKLGY
jgi:hypothetical protein